LNSFILDFVRIHHPHTPSFAVMTLSPWVVTVFFVRGLVLMHAQVLMLIPIFLIIYGWVKSLPPPLTKVQKRKNRKSRRKKHRQGYVPVVNPGDEDDIMFDDTDYFPDQSCGISATSDDSTYTDDTDYLTDIAYSYLDYNIHHHDD
jgi:hypothetical protein